MTPAQLAYLVLEHNRTDEAEDSSAEPSEGSGADLIALANMRAG